MTVVQRWEGVAMFLALAVIVGMIARASLVSGRVTLARGGLQFRRQDNPQLFLLVWLPIPGVALLLFYLALGLALGWINR
jgi:hypothetical protein